MPFTALKQNLKVHFKTIVKGVKYGDSGRLPLDYIKIHGSSKASLYRFPKDVKDEPFEYYQAFPKLSETILLSLFSSIGVIYLPEVARFELKEKRPLKIFENFVLTFGAEGNEIDSHQLNRAIERMKKMDLLREKYPLNSEPIYKALIYKDIEKADDLIEQMREALRLMIELIDSYPKHKVEIEERFVKEWYNPKILQQLKKRIDG